MPKISMHRTNEAVTWRGAPCRGRNCLARQKVPIIWLIRDYDQIAGLDSQYAGNLLIGALWFIARNWIAFVGAHPTCLALAQIEISRVGPTLTKPSMTNLLIESAATIFAPALLSENNDCPRCGVHR